jgi:hypothetical protein
VGEFHARLTWVPDDAVATSPVGGFGGMFFGGAEVLVGVATDSGDGFPVPIALIADTLKMYVVPVFRLVTLYLVTLPGVILGQLE